MWALRRASNPLKNRRLHLEIACIHGPKSELSNSNVENSPCSFNSPPLLYNEGSSFKRFYSRGHGSSQLFMGQCSFSSQAGAKNSGDEDDVEDGFSELETPLTSESNELTSDSELSDDVESAEDELDFLETGTDSSKKKLPGRAPLQLFIAIVAEPSLSVASVLDKWVEEGKDLSRTDIALTFVQLRRRRMFGKALELSEWLEKYNKYEFQERDYASRVDLIAKLRGLQKAESYIEHIPASFRGEVVYRTLLANTIREHTVKKAEHVFNKMRDLGFPISAFACNQLLLLYKKHDKKKIADVLLLMEKENVKPTPFTYRVLIDTKGQSRDLDGMDQIVETMKAEDVEPDTVTQAILAKHYISCGAKEKAETILKEMEHGDLEKSRRICYLLLPLYADLGKPEEVRRVWKVCESRPRAFECLAAIEAWGRLKEVKEAEAVFDRMLKQWKKLSSKQYAALLRVYVNSKLLDKGKDLIKRMVESGCRVEPLTWDAIVKLYVGAGEVEKADSILHRATEKNLLKPMFSSYKSLMDEYAKRGDVHNAEKIFQRMRQSGYTARFLQFQALLQAYVNAKRPAYGMRDRMKADEIFPNKALAALLADADPFKKSAMSDVFE